MNLPTNKIICGEAKEVLKTLPAGSINCCISSPPYWAIRDYGVAGQLGLESTFEEYIDKLCSVYDEVKRVLRKDGTCWVNLGDTYSGSGGDHKAHHKNDASFQTGLLRGSRPTRTILPDKSLCLIPQRFAIEMVNRGWILRNVIIWHKPNPMPSSAKDRFTVDFEYVYFFVKNKRYWFEPQYEKHKYPDDNNRPQGNVRAKGTIMAACNSPGNMRILNPLGRNKRTVWTIPTQAEPEAHFATFPDRLVEPMIKAGCPEFICRRCGKAREKIWDTSYEFAGGKSENEKAPKDKFNRSMSNYQDKYRLGRVNAKRKPAGYTDCGCELKDKWRPGIVLDPFCGTGTVGKVAAQLRRDYVLIDLKEQYVKDYAIPKCKAVETGVSVKEQLAGQLGLFE